MGWEVVNQKYHLSLFYPGIKPIEPFLKYLGIHSPFFIVSPQHIHAI
jgi:hypothetical protein